MSVYSMLRKWLLVAAMIGIEACITLEVILMIANVQTLGVPVRYASIPGTVGASCSLLFIPTLGYVMDRWAKSKISKAKILVFTTSIQMIGTSLIFTANTVKLLLYDDGHNATTANVTNASTTTQGFPVESSSKSPGSEHIYFYAIIAMVGYSLNDCGYDSSCCFLKTFSLASTPKEEQSSIIVQSSFVSSLGGCLIAILGSIGLGTRLTAGTSHDINAAQSAFLSALCFVLVASGLTITLTTGFCCSPSSSSPYEEIVNEDQTKFVHKEEPPTKSGVLGFVRRQKDQIIINISAFFLMGSLYSYEVYVVNFVGEGILDGDPQADTNSQQYKNYVRGIEIGSSGTLIYYISFIVFNVFQEFLLRKIGWKIEMIIICIGHVAVNLVCALTAELWAFYITTVWTGFFRATAMTVPYILANQFAFKLNGDKNSGVVIAVVASMLPCGFILCSALMGPLIDVTGNPATPVYYTAATSLLGLLVIVCLKSE
ncbi:membrane-associated transporter protein-like [Physella acuta]|uniref:membrane-associated transporter protein-like n=1 Tax=Physella acuta TaxID=109671 RepID=UPI0027DC38B9|nr:membrane-associated transporter protein-like [Physella acuta]